MCDCNSGKGNVGAFSFSFFWGGMLTRINKHGNRFKFLFNH